MPLHFWLPKFPAYGSWKLSKFYVQLTFYPIHFSTSIRLRQQWNGQTICAGFYRDSEDKKCALAESIGLGAFASSAQAQHSSEHIHHSAVSRNGILWLANTFRHIRSLHSPFAQQPNRYFLFRWHICRFVLLHFFSN